MSMSTIAAPDPGRAAPARRQMRLLLLALSCAASAGCVGNPVADAGTTEAIHEIVNELGMLRDDNAVLQAQVDSLRTVVARQDSLLRQVANLSGIPITR